MKRILKEELKARLIGDGVVKANNTKQLSTAAKGTIAMDVTGLSYKQIKDCLMDACKVARPAATGKLKGDKATQAQKAAWTIINTLLNDLKGTDKPKNLVALAKSKNVGMYTNLVECNLLGADADKADDKKAAKAKAAAAKVNEGEGFLSSINTLLDAHKIDIKDVFTFYFKKGNSNRRVVAHFSYNSVTDGKTVFYAHEDIYDKAIASWRTTSFGELQADQLAINSNGDMIFYDSGYERASIVTSLVDHINSVTSDFVGGLKKVVGE